MSDPLDAARARLRGFYDYADKPLDQSDAHHEADIRTLLDSEARLTAEVAEAKKENERLQDGMDFETDTFSAETYWSAVRLLNEAKSAEAAANERAELAEREAAEVRRAYLHERTQPCSACGDGDVEQKYHKHALRPKGASDAAPKKAAPKAHADDCPCVMCDPMQVRLEQQMRASDAAQDEEPVSDHKFVAGGGVLAGRCSVQVRDGLAVEDRCGRPQSAHRKDEGEKR